MRIRPSCHVPVLLLALAGTATVARAQDGAGTEGALVLQLSAAPRPVALGDAYVALAEGPLALHYGPAGLAAGGGVDVAYQTLPTDATAGLAGMAVPLGPGVLGAGLAFVDYGDVQELLPDQGGLTGTPTGRTVGGGEVAVSLGYAVRVGVFRVGVVARSLNVDVAGLGTISNACDVGAAMTLFRERLTVAAAFQNLGPDVAAGRPAPLPTQGRLGAAWRLITTPERRLLVTVEARSLRSELDGSTPVTAAGGVEWAMRVGGAWVAARAGYRQKNTAGDAASAFAAGGGVRLGRWALDYAYRPMGPLGATQHLGLAYTPGR